MSKQAWLLLVASLTIGPSAPLAEAPAPLVPPPDPWRAPTIVTVEGNMGVASMFPSGGTLQSSGLLGRPQALLLRDGDIVLFREKTGSLPYRAGDGCDLEVAFSEFGIQLWGTTAYLSLGRQAGLDWVSMASDAQLADLRMVEVSEDPDEDTLAALDVIAAANPRVDLDIEAPETLDEVLARITPRTIMGLRGSSDDPETWEVLAKQTKLETLVVEDAGRGLFQVLPGLTKLSRLFVIKWDAEESGPLPPGLTSLRSLGVIGDIEELTDLGELPPTLGELSLIGVSWKTDLEGLEKLTGLHTLVLWGEDGSDIDLASLDALKHLRWLSLPSDVSPAQLSAIACAHPRLTVLQLASDGDPMVDLEPLRDLAELNALTLVNDEGHRPVLENLEAIHGLTSLAFIGLSEDVSEDGSGSRADMAHLRRALPDAMLVTVDPKCLGSGWILLLLMAFVIAWIRARRQHSRAQSA